MIDQSRISLISNKYSKIYLIQPITDPSVIMVFMVNVADMGNKIDSIDKALESYMDYLTTTFNALPNRTYYELSWSRDNAYVVLIFKNNDQAKTASIQAKLTYG